MVRILVALDPRLEADCHRLFSLDAGELLLHRTASVPWLILVPHGEWTSLLDMSTETRLATEATWHRVAAALSEETECDRINIAAIGNVVAQLHLHVIARRADDSFWPGVVWGQDLGTSQWSEAEVDSWRDRLRARLVC